MAINTRAGFTTVDAIVFNNIIMPGGKTQFEQGILLGGVFYPAGSVLGLATGGGNAGLLVLSATAAGDGSQTPYAILLENVSAYDVDGVTARNTSMKVLVGGVVNPTALNYGTGHSAATVKAALSTRGISFNTPGYSG